MESTRNFIFKGAIFAILLLVTLLPTTTFAQSPDTGFEPLTVTGADAYREYGSSGWFDFNTAGSAGVEYTRLYEFQPDNGSETYSVVVGQDGTKWMIREWTDEGFISDTRRQDWARMDDALHENTGWAADIADSDLGATAGAEAILRHAYQGRLEDIDRANGGDGSRYTLINGAIDNDGTGNQDDFTIMFLDNQTGELRVGWHEDFGSTFDVFNDDIFDLRDTKTAAEALADEDFLDDAGIDETGDRMDLLRQAANAQNAFTEANRLERELAAAQQAYNEAVAARDAAIANNATQEEIAAAQEAVNQRQAEVAAAQRAISESQAVQDRNNTLEDLRDTSITDSSTNRNPLEAQLAKARDAVIDAVTNLFHSILKGIAWLIMQATSLFLGAAGVALNFVVDQFIVNMATKIDELGALDIAWTAIRDVMNMLFIFIILYIAGSIILQFKEGQAKSLLAKVIIIAILINFSLFLTKVVVDVANILTLSLNQGILSLDNENGANLQQGQTQNGLDAIRATGISGQMMNGLGISRAFGGQTLSEDPFSRLLQAMVLGTFMVITGAVFFVVAFMLLVRFVVLVILMILSPAAFVGFILPQLKSTVTDKWTRALVSNAFFPPVFFLLLSIVFRMMQSPAFQLTQTNVLAPGIGEMVVNYTILIAFVLASLWVSKEIGAAGGGVAVNRLNGAGKWAKGAIAGGAIGAGAFGYRNTIGRAANRVAQSAYLQERASKSRVGMAALKGIRGVAGAGGDRSYTSRLAARAKQREEDAKSLGNLSLARERRLRYDTAERDKAKKAKAAAKKQQEEAKTAEETTAANDAFKKAEAREKKYNDRVEKAKRFSKNTLQGNFVESREQGFLGGIAKSINKSAVKGNNPIAKAVADVSGRVARAGWVTNADATAAAAIQRTLKEEKKKDSDKKEAKQDKDQAKKDKADNKKLQQEQIEATRRLADAIRRSPRGPRR